MKFNGSDVVRAKAYYKNHSYRVDGVEVKQKVFVDWGESRCEDYVIYGSPFQVGFVGFGQHNGGYSGTVDTPVLITEEIVHTSTPNPDSAVTPPTGPVHYKPGVNV